MDISDLLGKTLTSAEQRGNNEIVFTLDDGRQLHLYHEQDCCESVTIEDVCGDLNDLVGSPLLQAEEVSGETAQPEGWKPGECDESYTWTFYRLATVKGYVTIRWFGSSNGYYSESVDFGEVGKSRWES